MKYSEEEGLWTTPSCDFERQPGEEIKQYAPRRDAMPSAVPRIHASRGESYLASITVRSVLYPNGRDQDEENEEAQVLEENERLSMSWRSSTRKQRP